MKHTPGPWYAHNLGIGQNGAGPYTYPLGTDPDEAAANARLIAAAPDLLAALQHLTATARSFRNVPKDEQEWTSLDDAALEEAFAAIRKAMGD